MYPIHTLFSNCALYYFRGCITQLVVWVFKASGFHLGMISTVQIYIFPVYLYWFLVLLVNLNVLIFSASSDGHCDLYPLDCTPLGDSWTIPSTGLCLCFPTSMTKSSCYLFRFLVNQRLVQQPSFSSIFVFLNWAVISWISKDHHKSLISSLTAVTNLLGNTSY